MPDITLALPPSRASAPVDYVTRMDAWLGGDLQNLVAQINSLDASDWFSVQSSPTDDTPGRVMTVGAFGVGGNATQYLGDVDSVDIPSGEYFVGASATGTKPDGRTVGHLTVRRATQSSRTSQTWRFDGGQIYNRYYLNSTGWTPWSETIHQGNILGDVSGSLTENLGAVVQYGNLPNGEFWRFAGGLQICKRSVDLGSRSSTSGAGGLHRSDTFSFGLPSGFASGSFVGASISGDLFPNGLMHAVSCNTSQWSVRIGAVAPFAAVDCGDVVLTAFGPWASQ